jgi:hypothetical protein
MAYYFAGAALIACSLLWCLYRTISLKLIVNDIKRRLAENDSFYCILALFHALPLRKLWEESFEFDNYVKALIKDAPSLNKCLLDIRVYLSNEKKREIVLELITESMDRTFSTEDLAKIYADCIMKNVAHKTAGLDDDIFNDERHFIGLIITKKHLTRDVDQRQESFRARVMRILEDFIAETTNKNERVLTREAIIRFENSRLPTHEDYESRT